MKPLSGTISSKCRAGISAIEMMVALAVVCILFGAAIPSALDFIQRQRMSVTVNEFFAAVMLARSEAIQRGMRVDLVPAGDGTDWTKGWVVLIDRNGNLKADAGDQVIFAHGPVTTGLSIKAAFTDPRPSYLSYTANGHTRTRASSQTRQMGSWLFTLNGLSRRIIINFLGRPRVCDPVAEAATC